MSKTAFDDRFFSSTRGRIVTLLRRANRTVNDLAAELDLTDNAVRAHLLSLERDRLVESAGMVKGVRKPHVAYKLTHEARHLFPKAYDSLLNRLLDVLKARLPRRAVGNILQDVGSGIASNAAIDRTLTLDEKVDAVLTSLEELGGAAVAVKKNGNIVIQSESCPFAEAVAEHPEVCKVAEAMVGEMTGEKTTETCDRTGAPKCCFVIESS